MSKEPFDQILAAIDESPDDVPQLILSKIKTRAFEEEVRKFYNYDNILKVMQSSRIDKAGQPGPTGSSLPYENGE